MLDEIIPASKPLQWSKILTAEPEVMDVLPEVNSKISFLTFISYLEEKLSTLSEIRANFYKHLINKIEAEPSLLEPVEDIQKLEEQSDLFELLSTMLFPVVGRQEKNSFALAAPYQFEVFYFSDSFKKLFLDEEEQHLLLPYGM